MVLHKNDLNQSRYSDRHHGQAGTKVTAMFFYSPRPEVFGCRDLDGLIVENGLVYLEYVLQIVCFHLNLNSTYYHYLSSIPQTKIRDRIV